MDMCDSIKRSPLDIYVASSLDYDAPSLCLETFTFLQILSSGYVSGSMNKYIYDSCNKLPNSSSNAVS